MRPKLAKVSHSEGVGALRRSCRVSRQAVKEASRLQQNQGSPYTATAPSTPSHPPRSRLPQIRPPLLPRRNRHRHNRRNLYALSNTGSCGV